MNYDKLKMQLIIDEGFRTRAYLDSKGLLTVGIGHLIQPSDGICAGDTISVVRVNDFFEHDLVHAEINCRQLIKNFDSLPDDIQNVCMNMCFNLGGEGFKGFKKFIAALEIKDYYAAALEMKNSRWWEQVGARAGRLQATVLKYANNDIIPV